MKGATRRLRPRTVGSLVGLKQQRDRLFSTAYNRIDPSAGAPIFLWTKGVVSANARGRELTMYTAGVPLEEEAEQQLRNVAQLPIIHSHVAVMPDGARATRP